MAPRRRVIDLNEKDGFFFEKESKFKRNRTPRDALLHSQVALWAILFLKKKKKNIERWRILLSPRQNEPPYNVDCPLHNIKRGFLCSFFLFPFPLSFFSLTNILYSSRFLFKNLINFNIRVHFSPPPPLPPSPDLCPASLTPFSFFLFFYFLTPFCVMLLLLLLLFFF